MSLSFIKNLFKGAASSSEAVKQAPSKTIKKNDADVTPKNEGASIQLNEQNVLTGQMAQSKQDVMKIISDKMVELNFVSADYTQALLDREDKVSTYLINGVAIPHGTNEAKSLVNKTGIVVVQIPEGVQWNEKGDVVYLAVGIAAKGNEHLNVLQQLTNVVMDEQQAHHLGKTASAQDIAVALGQKEIKTAKKKKTLEIFETQQSCTVIDAAGIHARPASLIAEMATSFRDTTIHISNKDKTASAKSMAKLLTIGATHGSQLIISAKGTQAEYAVKTIADAINAGLDPVDDEAEDHSSYTELHELPALTKPEGRVILTGAAASSGIAMAQAFTLKETTVVEEEKNSDTEGQKATLSSALIIAGQQLDSLHEKMEQAASGEAAIFKAQKLLLQDEDIVSAATQKIEEGYSAVWAWTFSLNQQIEQLQASDCERIQARAADMKDLSARVVAILKNDAVAQTFPEVPFVLVARELTPSQTANLNGLPVKAICTELGGPNSHMAILSRALGIPAIVGVGSELLTSVNADEPMIVDPQSGSVILSPDAETAAEAEANIKHWGSMQEKENAARNEPAITKDNRRIDVVCNVAKPEEADSVLSSGGEGVGLLRTEFLFEASETEPSVDEQAAALQAFADKLGSKTLIVRTADIGGDKPVSWLNMPHEENPFLGVRGIRLSFKHEEMFRKQLKAIYQVALAQQQQGITSGIHIMFPMIAKLSEWRKARDIANEVREAMNAPVLPMGIMVEVPSVGLMASHFAKEVDFFSIGSNDLTQYTMAMDRMHPDLCDALDSYNPALLNLISMTVKAADAEGKWVGVCGNMAADPDLAKILIGLGVKELSVSPSNIAAVKHLVRNQSYQELQEKAQQALTLESPESVKAFYQNKELTV